MKLLIFVIASVGFFVDGNELPKAVEIISAGGHHEVNSTATPIGTGNSTEVITAIHDNDSNSTTVIIRKESHAVVPLNAGPNGTSAVAASPPVGLNRSRRFFLPYGGIGYGGLGYGLGGLGLGMGYGGLGYGGLGGFGLGGLGMGLGGMYGAAMYPGFGGAVVDQMSVQDVVIG